MSDAQSKTTDAALLDWLGRHPQCELSYNGWDEDPEWQVHKVTGNRNDREWRRVGRGETVREAIRSAMQNMTPPRKRKEPANVG